MKKIFLLLSLWGAPLALMALPLPGAHAVLHPQYTLNSADLLKMMQTLPAEVRKVILTDPKAFLEDYKPLLTAPADLLVLVDKKNGLPANYEPQDLVSLKGTGLATSRSDLSLRKAYLPYFQKLSAAAQKNGLTLKFSSTYRSYKYQAGLFDRYVKQDGLAAAERYSARAGHSQHQLGTIVDFGSITEAFAQTKEGVWLFENAGAYGLSLSFPQGYESLTGYQYEPWHYRFIGVEACLVQKKYFANIQQYLLQFHHQWGAQLKASFHS